MEKEKCHVPVMAREVAAWLGAQRGGCYLDATCGGGSLSAVILGASASVKLVAIDWDRDALAHATRRLTPFAGRFTLLKGSFSQAKAVLARVGWERADGVVLDLGVSSLQLDTASRGFSFMREGPLDMRMDQARPTTAADLVNSASLRELTRIIRLYGEERRAARIAKAIVRARDRRPITRTTDLANLIESIIPRSGRLHPATRTFQALRIAVNDELGELERFLSDGYALLNPGGRMVIIAYHSLEDRLVKHSFRRWARDCLCPPRSPVCTCGWGAKVRVLTATAVPPGPEGVAANPRARSARLRVVEALAEAEDEG